MFDTYQEAALAYQQHRPMFEERGIYLPEGATYTWGNVGRDSRLAMDALPALSTDPNSAIPWVLTNLIDPDIYKVLWAPLMAAEIFGEVRKGSWTDNTAMFPIVETTGEISAYGDYNENGRASANANWPQRQSWLFQGIPEYGDLEIARAALGKINWVGEVDGGIINVINLFQNITYFFGVQGLQNYGLTNDPGLTAAITPATKAYGGVKWVSGGVVVATANEVFNDVQALFGQLILQTDGLIDADTPMVLAVANNVQLALTAINSFNVNVMDLLRKTFKNLEIKVAIQYNGVTSTSPVGIAAGNEIQLIAKEVEGQKTGYCAYNEKLRAHPIVRMLSSFRKKLTAGTWGAVVRQPANVAQMVGM